MLTIWSTVSKSKTLSALSPVLRSVPDVPVEIRNDFGVSPGTKIILVLGSQALGKLQAEKIVAKNSSLTSLRTKIFSIGMSKAMVSYSPEIGDTDYGYYTDLLTDVSLAIRYILTGQIEPIPGDYQYRQDFSEIVDRCNQLHEATGAPVDVTHDLETVGLNPYALPGIHPSKGTPLPSFPGAYIVSLAFTVDKGISRVVHLANRATEEARLKDPVFRSQLEFLFTTPWIRLKGANLKYDFGWHHVRTYYCQVKSTEFCTNFCFDTTLVGSLLDENRANTLDVHAKIYTNTLGGYADAFNNAYHASKGKNYDPDAITKRRMDLIPPAILLPYAGGDTDAEYQVAAVQKPLLMQDPELVRFYVNILHPASRAFEDIEQGGIFVSMDAYKELQSTLEAAMVDKIKSVCKILGGRIVAKHWDLSKFGGINLTKAALIKDFMFSPMGLNLKPRMYCEKPDKDGQKVPSTASEHLDMFLDVPEAKPFILESGAFQSAKKTYDTYVLGFLSHLRSDGRYHPTFYLYAGDKDEGEGGTNTGRLSARDPALQTLPKHTIWAQMIRRCFIAPPGYVIGENDYSAGELRVIACLADEDHMIAAFRHKLDIHLKTAGTFAAKSQKFMGGQFFGWSYDQFLALKKSKDPELSHMAKEIRQLGKAGNFGLVYKISVEGFQAYARVNYGVELTKEEATEFHAGFFEEYSKLHPYHEQQIAGARKYGQVRSPLGRIRHLPLIKSPDGFTRSKEERRSINSPTQGCLSDMMAWSLSIMKAEGITKIAPTWGACHDAGYSYIPEGKVDIIVPRQIEIMENLPFEKVGWQPQLKFLADPSIGLQNLGDMKEMPELKASVEKAA